MNAVEFEHVSKSYPVYASPADRLIELSTFGAYGRHREFQALKDVTFSVAPGEVFCIIGENGSGKSTALQLMAGIFEPSAGAVRVNGRVAALLELGSGFNPEFTGRENVYLNGAILGLSRKRLDAKFREIENFAEIGEFIDRPVRTYSSGMTVRLAFAVAIHVDPEILVVDEALAVGDAWFRQRCMRRINEMKDRGMTIVFVSHSVADVHAIGDRALWLEHGRVRAIGDADAVVAQYLAAAEAAVEAPASKYGTERELPAHSATVSIVDTIPNVDQRTGDGGASILGIAVLDEFGDPLHLIVPHSRIVVRISVKANRYLNRPDIGVRIRNHLGLDFASTGTARERHSPGPMNPGQILTAEFHFEIPELYPGAFSFSPWVCESRCESKSGLTPNPTSQEVVCDAIDNAVTMQMARGEGPVYGYIQVPCRIEVNPHPVSVSEMGRT